MLLKVSKKANKKRIWHKPEMIQIFFSGRIVLSVNLNGHGKNSIPQKNVKKRERNHRNKKGFVGVYQDERMRH